MQNMLKEIHNRMPKLTTYALEDWGAKRFGLKGGQIMVQDGYAIMGFWRGRGEQLQDLKWVLTGKGIAGHGAYWVKPDFRNALKDKNPRSSEADRTAKCDGLFHLRGFNVVPRFNDQMWLEDLKDGECVSAGFQYYKNGNQYFEDECYT
jgi:hypothetical protein